MKITAFLVSFLAASSAFALGSARAETPAVSVHIVQGPDLTCSEVRSQISEGFARGTKVRVSSWGERSSDGRYAFTAQSLTLSSMGQFAGSGLDCPRGTTAITMNLDESANRNPNCQIGCQ